jgi:hypothetical protein
VKDDEPSAVVIVRPDRSMRRQRADEVNLITAVLVVVCGTGWLSGLVPVVGDVVGAVVVAALLSAVGVVLLRWAVRRVRWYVEDREDDRLVALRRTEDANSTAPEEHRPRANAA